MSDSGQILWTPGSDVRGSNRRAPVGGSAALGRVLGAVNRELQAVGTALLWPRFDGVARWWAGYVGEEPERVRRWLSSRLEAPLEEIAAGLFSEAPRPSGAVPEPVTLGSGGLWVVWDARGRVREAEETLERFRRELEFFVEEQRGEELHFRSAEAPLGEEATRALKRGDEAALPELLALTRTVSGADFAYLGVVHDGVLDVEWHLGAGDSGFGFELPIGEGVGGRVSAGDRMIEIPDYRNCEYRYPEVSDITDSEQVRSVLAVPVHGAGGPGAVLYAVRREVSGFSGAQKSLLQRLSKSIEPAPGALPSSRHFFPARQYDIREMRSGLRFILGGSNRIQDVEAWLERVTGGPAILVDHQDRPYLLRNAERFEQLTGSRENGEPWIVELDETAGSGGGGSLYLWPASELPLGGWTDFVEDVAVACSVVIDRAEQGYHQLNQRRSRWVGDVMEGKADAQLLREGNRLGLPIESGEVWAIAWSPGPERDPGKTRKEMLAEDIGLDQLGSPLISLDGNVGVFLVKGDPEARPSAVRDELLKSFGPDPLWLVHDASYESLQGLKEALIQAIGIAEKSRDDGEQRYVAEVKGWGLDSLLEHPRISEELAAFGEGILAPLVTYDHERGSRLTETFCLSLTLDSTSEAAQRLYVHENTVRYRVRRAAQILGRDPGSPKERVTLGLAAYVWLRSRQ